MCIRDRIQALTARKKMGVRYLMLGDPHQHDAIGVPSTAPPVTTRTFGPEMAPSASAPAGFGSCATAAAYTSRRARGAARDRCSSSTRAWPNRALELPWGGGRLAIRQGPAAQPRGGQEPLPLPGVHPMEPDGDPQKRLHVNTLLKEGWKTRDAVWIEVGDIKSPNMPWASGSTLSSSWSPTSPTGSAGASRTPSSWR